MEKLEVLVKKITEGWEENRPVYTASRQEIQDLIKAGGQLVCKNQIRGGDDVYHHEALALGKKFHCITTSLL
ncbi:MAG: hypothetical protein A2589_00540 [Candidatus Vogelbacteria bacterium RIFOXYD1_FULL_46_19]|uniref:Uncharacterized protein n=1 Tax=Candidatus Vogelbacteria bacterium RIFOXYD1_FULL_46_19 TaxID=1802439 RepID=A0A1G2QIF8_9BACT|nr:MAG: hypothetical protein A2589_00540 [Candidatus Vogelbacteria bacterium RIFOXYD1_FULL_46_19]